MAEIVEVAPEALEQLSTDLKNEEVEGKAVRFTFQGFG